MRALASGIALLLALATPAQSFNGRAASEWVKDLAAADAAIRDYAVWALVTMGERAVRPALRALDDERPVVRQHAAKALGRIGKVAARAKDKLGALQQDAVPEVAKAAAVALLRVQVDATQLPELVAALRGDDWDLQLAAAEVVAELGPKASGAALALTELVRRDDAALDRTVEQRLKTAPAQRWNVRAAAALALGAIGPVDGVPIVDALQRASQNSEWVAREGAAKALPAFAGDDKAVVLLFALLNDNDWPVRRAAAEAMAKAVGPTHPRLPTVVPLMTLALQDQDGGVRRLAAEFLGGCGAAAASAVPELAQMLGSRDKNNREYALEALRRIGPAAAAAKDALVACHEAMPEADDRQRRQVLEALAAVAPEARRELPALEKWLAERDKPAPTADVQRHEAIVAALAGLQGADGKLRIRALTTLAEMHAVEAIPSLLPWLDDGRPAAERSSAIHALVALDADKTVPRLRELLGSKEREVRTAAANGLAMFDDAESRPRTVKVLTEGLAFANSDQLWYLGMTAVPELAPALERIVANDKEHWRRRWGATQALSYLHAPTSAAHIAAMVAEVAGDDAMRDEDRQELLAVGLRVLAGFDAAPHRELFAAHAKADEDPVRQAATMGLARLGDAEALAALRQIDPQSALAYELPDELRRRFEAVHVRLSQVKGCTLRDVLVRLRTQLAMPIEVSKQADPKVLDGRFGNYIYLLGFHPSALHVLSAIQMATFSGGTLHARFFADRVELLTPAEAGSATKR